MLACGQANVSRKTSAIQQEKLVYDTSKIAIIPLGKMGLYMFENATPTPLTNDDLKIVDRLLNECINKHMSPDYIDLCKYKLQYMPLTDSTGDRKVYISGFCNDAYMEELDSWKKDLVIVDDGGSCFFHVTINLSRKEYEHLFVNGYA